MTPRHAPTAVVSAKGQVVLPKEIRDARRWAPGTRLLVEETECGVLLSAAPGITPTKPEDVFGSMSRPGKAMSIEDMDAGIAEQAKQHACD